MKTQEEILKQRYIDATDLKQMFPKIGIVKCREYIDKARERMAELNYFVPEGRTKYALTSVIVEMFGWK